jgi:nucleotide-binding universal stress UspA family protein
MIVVGIDGSEGAAHALRWALEEAKLRKTGILAVHAWTMPAPPGMMGLYTESLQDPETFRVAVEKAMESFVDEALPERDGTPVELRIMQGSPAEALVAAAQGAEMLVVGSRGHGGFASLLLGSVSQQCAHHASCPVTIVRP